MNKPGKRFQSKASVLGGMLIIVMVFSLLMPLAAVAGGGGADSPAVTVILTGKVNIRKAPNLKADIIVALDKGKTLPYLNDSQTDERGQIWYNVLYNNTSSWVSGKYSYRSDDAPTGGGTTDPSPYTGTLTATGNVNIRNQPSVKDGKIRGILGKGKTLPATGFSVPDAEGRTGVVWYEVLFQGEPCYVSSLYSGVVPGK